MMFVAFNFSSFPGHKVHLKRSVYALLFCLMFMTKLCFPGRNGHIEACVRHTLFGPNNILSRLFLGYISQKFHKGLNM